MDFLYGYIVVISLFSYSISADTLLCNGTGEAYVEYGDTSATGDALSGCNYDNLTSRTENELCLAMMCNSRHYKVAVFGSSGGTCFLYNCYPDTQGNNPNVTLWEKLRPTTTTVHSQSSTEPSTEQTTDEDDEGTTNTESGSTSTTATGISTTSTATETEDQTSTSGDGDGGGTTTESTNKASATTGFLVSATERHTAKGPTATVYGIVGGVVGLVVLVVCVTLIIVFVRRCSRQDASKPDVDMQNISSNDYQKTDSDVEPHHYCDLNDTEMESGALQTQTNDDQKSAENSYVNYPETDNALVKGSGEQQQISGGKGNANGDRETQILPPNDADAVDAAAGSAKSVGDATGDSVQEHSDAEDEDGGDDDDDEDIYSTNMPDDPSLCQEPMRFDPTVASKIRLFPDTPKDAPEQPLPAPAPAPAPAPGANTAPATDYAYVYTHFKDEGRARGPIKKPSQESVDGSSRAENEGNGETNRMEAKDGSQDDVGILLVENDLYSS